MMVKNVCAYFIEMTFRRKSCVWNSCVALQSVQYMYPVLVQKVADRLDLSSIESDRNVIRTQLQAVSQTVIC